jgi:glyoxylase-like metal-dependent hydrolase (beta-lactamase superfamily II)
VGSTAAAASFALPAVGSAPFATAQGPGVYRTKLGAFQITSVDDGTWFLPIDGKFVRNASGAEVDRALRAAFLPPRILPITFTALLVNTGSKLVLIDTGTAGQVADTAGVMLDNLAAAGVTPDRIDTVLISHFHPDHIDGIKTKDGDKVFANAEIWVPEPEWAYWMNGANMAVAPKPVVKYFLNARRIFGDIAKDVQRFYGHTPGHTAFAIHSGNQSMLAMSDTVRNPYLFARHPDWQPIFDMDGPLAVKTRRRMLDRAAADRMLVEAYHFPFPACGHMVKRGAGYELVPAEWRPLQ